MLRIGIIGAGRIGEVHARSVASHPEACVAMISDPRVEAATALANKYGGVAVADAAEIFASDEVDAVVIGSPTPLHVEHILAAVKAGKPALCEKPVAMDLQAAEDLLRQLPENAPVMMGFNRRFDPSFAKIHRLASEGAIGDVEQVTITSRDPAPPPLEYVKISGGIFKDMTIHDFDMARFFLGDITEVTTIGQNLDPEIAAVGDVDAAVIVLKNKAGAVATIINSRHCATGYDQRLEVFGPKGSLTADNLRETTVMLNTAELSDAREAYLDFFLERYTAAYIAELTEFIRVAASGGQPSPTVKDGVEALRLAVAAEESLRDGVTVKL